MLTIPMSNHYSISQINNSIAKHWNGMRSPLLGGSGGMLRQKILKFKLSEIRFPAFWESKLVKSIFSTHCSQTIYLCLGYWSTSASFTTASVKTVYRLVEWISKRWINRIFHFFDWWPFVWLTTFQKLRRWQGVVTTSDCIVLESVGLTGEISSLEWSVSFSATKIHP